MFIKFLTDPGDVVVNIFQGSNTTGYVAETHKRNWYSFDEEINYVAASAFWFLGKGADKEELSEIYNGIKSGETINLDKYSKQLSMFREDAAKYQA